MRYLSTLFLKAVLVASLGAVAAGELRAQPGVTTTVQTFTYGSPSDGKFIFPQAGKRYQKILMHYKLRCPYGAACGEWDYLMYINLFNHTGVIDSARDTATNYSVDGLAPDSLGFMRSPSWWYLPVFQTSVVYTDTASLTTASFTAGTKSSELPFNGGSGAGRAQYLWKKGELTAAGLTAGNITGLRLNSASGNETKRNLTIRIKKTTLDSLGTASFESAGLTTVYAHDTKLSASGWSYINFTTPFAWDGSSNLVVDVSYDGSDGTNTVLLADSTPYVSGVASTGADNSLHFEGKDFIDVPAGVFAPVDSLLTIAFWQYGNPAFQPQEQSIFEGYDVAGRRVINMHLPWSDSLVYWDAGNLAGYDRVSKKAAFGDYAGKWNYWVVTKNVKSKTMKVYLNGALFTSGTGKLKPVNGIASFKIGSAGNGTSNYDGNIDELAVWNAELDAATIKAWMNRPLDASHPFSSSLRLYYRFNGGTLGSTPDASGHGFDGTLVGPPNSQATPGAALHTGFAVTSLRPNIVFEQGSFTSHLDSTLRIDSVQKAPMQVVRYDPAKPGVPLDTMTVWPAYYRVSFNAQGKATDSTLVRADSTFHLVRTPYFRKFEVIDRYEIGRYITPYGNGLDLGNGFDWVYDVTDYAPFLHDTVYLSAYNQQEMVDLSFEMIEGTPPRDVLDVRNLWNGLPAYGGPTSIETFLTPKRVLIPADAANTRLKMRTTGHGFGGNENCSEFCPKVHTIKVNGVSRYDTLVFKQDCGMNPVYPQGGTWVYNRSNWCPGSDVPTYDLELTPWVTPGDSVTLDYDVEGYSWNGQGTTPYYDIETQLVTYSAPNFTLDAAIDQIKAPSTTDAFKRMNPICGGPVITIQNTGSTPLTSLTITYGISGGTQSVYHWTGNLKFLERADVHLDPFSWSGTSHTFQAVISEPNGGADEYPYNNMQRSDYTFPPEYPSQVIFDLKTNNFGEETSYEITDASTGQVVWSRKELAGATVYKDTLNLPNGCYEFRLRDAGGDGLSWWANTDAGTGYMRVRRGSNNSIITTFNPDFGSEIYQQFTVGYFLAAVPEAPVVGENRMEVYPNPTHGEFSLDLKLSRRQDVEVMVRDLLGRTIHDRTISGTTGDVLNLDLTGQPAGVYIVSVRTDAGVISRKIVMQ
jgi:hypothetical protein